MQRPHDLPGALDGGVGAFHGFDRHAGGFRDHNRLPDIMLRKLASHGASIFDVLAFLLGRLARVSTPVFTSSGSSSHVEFSSVMPSSANTLAIAPSRESVLRVVSESKSLASRQSGRMLEKICLCLTCPAMTARRTPSR